MVSNLPPNNELVALLSVASALCSGSSNGPIQSELGGRSVLEWQIHALRHCGVQSFLIEVDNVSGSLLALVDNLRGTGLSIEFVRHARDLIGFLSRSTRLVVQAEAHYFAPSLLKKWIAHDAPFLATLDGREENATFELIDINTRWAGLGVLDTKNMASLDDVPEGWSLTSLLLRHAVQTGTAWMPIKQTHVHNFEIAVVATAVDAEILTKQLLILRRDAVAGLIEKYVFAPLAAILAPSIWRSPVMSSAIGGVPFVLASIGFACGLLGWKIGALVALFAATGARITNNIVMGRETGQSDKLWHSCLFWGLIVTAISSLIWLERYVGFNGLISVSMVTGLCVLAHRIAIPGWSRPFLRSPALVIAALLIVAIFSPLSEGTKFIALVQLALLLAGQYFPASQQKNNNQA